MQHPTSHPGFGGIALVLLAVLACGCAASAGRSEPLFGDDPLPVKPNGDEAAIASAEIDAEDLNDVRFTRFEEMLAGRLPGVRVTRRPNGDYVVRIRGAASFSTSASPLFVLDGVPIEPSSLENINPNDVSNIRVIKDGTAAFYGVLGANGVILITTWRAGS